MGRFLTAGDMLKTLSYLNLIFAVCYFLGYLQNSNALVISGLLASLVFNWLALRNLEREQFKRTLFVVFLALATLMFALYIGYSAVFLLTDAIAYQYYPLNTVLLIISGVFFAFSLLLHVFNSALKYSVKKDD